MASINKILTSDDVGINVHASYAAYKDRLPLLASRLNESGVGWIRDNDPAGAAKWRSAGYTGKVLTIVGSDVNAEVAFNNGSDAIDPVNEPSPTDFPTAKTTGQAIATKIADRLPVLGISLAQPTGANADALGYLPWADRPNCHCYRGMQAQPAWAAKQAEFIRRAGQAASGKATWVTEMGYHDYLVPGQSPTYKGKENGNHQMTPDYVAAQQIVPDIQGFFQLGADKVFVYELVDQWRYRVIDGAGDHEGFFGLLKDDLSWKPQGLAFIQWVNSLPKPDALASLQAQLAAEQAARAVAEAKMQNAVGNLQNAIISLTS